MVNRSSIRSALLLLLVSSVSIPTGACPLKKNDERRLQVSQEQNETDPENFVEVGTSYRDWDCEEIRATGRQIMTAVYVGAGVLTFEVFVTLGFGVRKFFYNRERILQGLGGLWENLQWRRPRNQDAQRGLEMP